MIYFVTNQSRLGGITNNIVISTFEKCLEYFKNHTTIQVDTETTGFDCFTCELLCVQLGDYENQWVIEKSAIDFKKLAILLENSEVTCYFQNAKFDLKFLYVNKIYPKNIFDTFLAECVLTTGTERKDKKLGLDDLCEKYLAIKLDKSIRGNIHKEGLTDRVILYAADDVKYLEKIADFQKAVISKYRLEELLQLENDVVKVFARMEFNGINLNTEKWSSIAKLTLQDTRSTEEELDSIVIGEKKLKKYVPKSKQTNLFGLKERELTINWGSPKQKLNILKDLGFQTDSTGERFLQKNKKSHLLISKLIDYNKSSKLNSSFGEGFLAFVNKNTGRIHCDVWQILDTGRISVSNPNLNQIPSKGDLGKEIRSCFIPSKGFKMVGGDYSGMELRIIAEFSQDPLWMKSFNDGQDLHSVLCAATFDIPITDVKKETPFKKGITYRDVQKTINFGLAYGMSKFKLADTMDISVDQADNIIKKFFKIVPEVDKFLTILGNFAKDKGFITTFKPYRRRRFFDQWSEAKRQDDFKVLGGIERAGKNTPIQGTNGDIIKLALCKVQDYIDLTNYPAKILLAVYDEIQTEVREDLAEEWKNKLDEIMIESAKYVLKRVPVVVDCKISEHWSK